MNPIQWLMGRFADSDQASTFYKRGMVKAKKHNHAGAIEDYTAALAVPDVAAEMQAMILYNRGLVYVAAGMAKQGADDLNSVIQMEAAAENVKRAAQRKLSRIQSRTKRIA